MAEDPKNPEFAITLDSIGDAVMATDTLGQVRRMNPPAQRLTGWTLDEARGRPLAEVFHIINAETRQPAANPVELVMRRGEVVGLANHTVLVARNGQEYHISDSAAPIRSPGGSIEGVVLVFSDVTESYLTQAALRESEQSYRSLLENLSTGVVVHGPDTAIQLTNPKAATLLGLTHDQLMGKAATDPDWSFLREDGTPMPLSDYPVNRVLTSGRVLQNYVAGVRHPGVAAPTWVLCNAFPVLEKDRLIKVVVTFTDISELRQAEAALKFSEQRWKFAIEGAGYGLWDWNVQSGKAYYSPQYMQMFGYDEADFGTTSEEWSKLIHPEDAPGVFAALQPYMEGKTGSANVEFRMLCKDGSWKWTLGRGMVMERDQDGKPLRMIGTNSDITEQKNAEAERLKLEKIESLGVLAGGIAHDFNNILTGILGNISFAMGLVEPEHPSFQRLVEAEKASRRAGELARQLLTFARGGDPLKKVISVEKALRESVALVLSGSNVKGILNTMASLQTVEADEGQLCQVFNNILINATQAMPDGGTITISAENERLAADNRLGLRAGPFVRISFTDTGLGIPADVLPKVFDPYFTTKSTGTGLGLASAHSIISRHGGAISVTSNLGNGASFTIYLPSTRGSGHEHPTASPLPEVGGHRGGSILVMDDERMIRDLTSEMLRHLGYQSVACDEGSKAVSLYRQALESGTPFSAVIMDLTIPAGMGGKETAKNILALDPLAYLIVSSGYSNDPVMADFATFGFRGVVAKPYSVEEFRRLLGSIPSGR